MYDQSRIGSRTGYLFQLLAGVGWTSLPALPPIRQPTLVLSGNDDPIIPLVTHGSCSGCFRTPRFTCSTTVTSG